LIWLNSTGVSYALDTGTLQIFGTTVNITDRKRAEENLVKNEKKQDPFLNNRMMPYFSPSLMEKFWI
jgi:hypothetical protein